MALSLHGRSVQHHQASVMLCLLSISPSLAAKQKQLSRLPGKYIEKASWRDKHMQTVLEQHTHSRHEQPSTAFHVTLLCKLSIACSKWTLKAIIGEQVTGWIKELQQQGSSGSTEMLRGYQKGHPVRLQPVFEDKKKMVRNSLQYYGHKMASM